jgi:hypothetical protein
MYSPSNYGSRHCFRCHLPLTDAASRNEGIGPVCRKLDNAVLARLIPSDIAKVLAVYGSVDPLTLTSETLPVFMALEASFNAPDAATRDDWRKEVKQMEWMLSHHQTPQNVEAIKGIVLALGYIGLVSLWNGDAASGLASVFCLEGRLAVSGPQNKAARIAFKKIPGYRFHGISTDFAKAAWSFPASKFAEFRMAIISHYPNFTGLNEAIEAAKTYTEEKNALAVEAAKQAALMAASLGAVEKAAPAPSQAPSNPLVTIIESGDSLKVKSPFCISYISELRAISKSALPRQWVPEEKVWRFPATHKAQVEALVEKHYGHH